MPYLGDDADTLLQTPPFLDPILARRMAQNNGPNPGVGSDPGPVPPPDAASTGVPPIPGQPPASVQPQQNPDVEALKQANARLATSQANLPPTPKPKWWQRLGAAALGGAAGYVNAEGRRMEPIDASKGEQAILNGIGYGQKMAEYNRQLKQAQAGVTGAQANLGADVTQAGIEREQAQAGYYKGENERALEVARTRANAQTQVAKTASARKIIESRSLGMQLATDPVPSGYSTMADPDNPDYVHILSPNVVSLPQELVPFASGRKPGDQIPYKEFQEAQKAANQFNIEKMKEAAKPPNAQQSKEQFEQTVGKMVQAGEIQSTDLEDMGKLYTAISRSKAVADPQERAHAQAYLAANTTPASGVTAGVLRAIAFGQNRIGGYVDTKTGQMFSLNADDVNQANKIEPGRFVPAQQALPQMGKSAIFRSMHYTIGNAKQKIAALSEFDAKTRAEISNAMRDTDPSSGLSKFLQGSIATTMTPQQKEAVQALQLLSEDMMALRSVAGMGQGSDLMREAILKTIPSGATPDKKYAQQQLDQIEQLVTRLQSGTAGLGQPATTSPNTPLNVPPGGARPPLNQIFSQQ